MKINHIAAGSAMSGLLLLSACGSWFHSTPAPTHTSTAPAPVVTHDSSQSTGSTHDIQAQLARQGYYHGPIDGVWGVATEGAVRNFQQNNNLPATGKLDNATMLVLHDTSNAPTN